MPIPRLSAAIIVKNEEAIILRCIENCKKFADEIIIVDTGSTDRTIELAKSVEGVQVFLSEKFDKDTKIADFSFSEAKNEAIRRCTGNRVIWWDADDTIDDANAKRIVSLSLDRKVALYSFTIEYGLSRFMHCRMFPNGLGICFDEAHACHEYLDPKGRPNLAQRDISIVHQPYGKKPCSSTRNLSILKTDYEKRNRRDQRTLFYLANSEMELGHNVDAIKHYDEYLAVSQWNEERAFARYYKAKCLLSLKRNSECAAECMRSHAEDMRLAEPLCLLGDLFRGLADYERAILWYKLASLIPFPTDCQLFVRKDLYENYPLDRIRDCQAASVKKVVSKRHILVRFPEDSAYHQTAIDACLRIGQSGQAAISFLCGNAETARKALAAGLQLGKPTDKFVEFDTSKNDVSWLCRSVGVVC
jgi:glycosyltransferase involved in cell wall biosynthesis